MRVKKEDIDLVLERIRTTLSEAFTRGQDVTLDVHADVMEVGPPGQWYPTGRRTVTIELGEFPAGEAS